MQPRKYRRMKISFEVLYLAPKSENLDEYFTTEDDDDVPGEPYPEFTLADDEHEDVLLDMSAQEMRASTSQKFQKELHLCEYMGDNQQIAAFLVTLCERFFITDITIHRPVEYEEKV